jgi:hypothetical protein
MWKVPFLSKHADVRVNHFSKIVLKALIWNRIIQVDTWSACIGNTTIMYSAYVTAWIRISRNSDFIYVCHLLISSVFSNWLLMTPSIATKFQYVNSPFYFSSHSLHISAPTGHPQVRYTIRCFQGLFLLQRIRCTYTTWRINVVCLYRYFDPWSPIHVIKLSIKVAKTLKFTAKTGLIYKM